MNMKTYTVDFVASEIKEVIPDIFAPYHITITPMKLREGQDMTTKKVAPETKQDPRIAEQESRLIEMAETIVHVKRQRTDLEASLREAAAEKQLAALELEMVKQQLARAVARGDFWSAQCRSVANLAMNAAVAGKEAFPEDQRPIPLQARAYKWSGEIDPNRGVIQEANWALAR